MIMVTLFLNVSYGYNIVSFDCFHFQNKIMNLLIILCAASSVFGNAMHDTIIPNKNKLI